MSKSADAVAWKRSHPRATVTSLAKRFGISRQAVSQALQRAGLSATPERKFILGRNWERAAGKVAAYEVPEPRFGARLPTNVVGGLAEILVCADLLKRGFDVYRAVTNYGRCDVVTVCRKTGTVNRIEVKCGVKTKAGRVMVAVPERNSFDTLAVLVGDGEIIYDPPLCEAEGTSV